MALRQEETAVPNKLNTKRGKAWPVQRKKELWHFFRSGKYNPVDFALDITKVYAGSGNADSKEIPRLLLLHIEMFVDLEGRKGQSAPTDS